ncbi:right-handed parallel beta-helix repeat-containing protein [Candidatus Micrarchaeota archaeon]|nr:right-handed parallel beta-helix repeat-containing protein [Candidatus Micrarchaeota archaeon]
MRTIALLSALFLVFGSSYAADVSGCQLISTPGNYVLVAPLTGANIPTPELEVFGSSFNTSFACIKVLSSDVTLDCSNYSISNNGTLKAAGIAVAGTNVTNYTGVTIKNCPDINGYPNGIMLVNTSRSRLQNITARNNWNTGIALIWSGSNNLSNCTASDANDGILLDEWASNNRLIGNSVFNNSEGISIIWWSTNNTVAGNSVHDNIDGIHQASGSNGTNFTNNSVYSNGDGFDLIASSHLFFDNNSILHNTRGMQLQEVTFSKLQRNRFHNNSLAGLYLNWNSNNTTIINNSIDGSTYCLTTLSPHNLTAINTHVFNCSYGVTLEDKVISGESTPAPVYIYNLTVDRAQGDFVNYTSLNITDIIEVNTSYSITWSSRPPTLPPNTTSFAGKFVTIKNETSTAIPKNVSIDTIVWQWQNGEINGSVNESAFALWKYTVFSGIWNNTNATLDTGTNTLTLTNMNPASVYAILQSNATTGNGTLGNCPVINAPGVVIQNQNYSGSPNGNLGITGTACVRINSSDVVFDCNGYNMSHNGAVNTIGIFAGSGLHNITVRNCPLITRYYYGVYFRRVNDSRVENVTSSHHAYAGFYFTESYNNVFTRNIVQNDTYGAYFTTNSKNSTITNNNASNNSIYGILVTNGADGCTVSDNVLKFNGAYGLSVGSSNSVVRDNLVHRNQNGLYLSGTNTTLQNNTLSNNTQFGAYLSNAIDCTFEKNQVKYNGGSGLYFDSTPGNNFSGNEVSGNGGSGFYLKGAMNNRFEANNVTNNGACGFNLSWGGEGSPALNNTLTGNNVTGNAIDGILLESAANTSVSGNNISGSGRNGITISTGTDAFSAGNNSVLLGNRLSDNALDLLVNASFDMYYTMSDNLFLNPAGTMGNFTNLSINDTVLASSAYSINWSRAPSVPIPGGYRSFYEKYVNITRISGNVSIDGIAWRWLDSELAGTPPYDENMLRVWKYNASGWNNTLAPNNPFTNTMHLSGMNPESIYAVLEKNEFAPSIPIDECTVINESGSYVLSANLTGNLSNGACLKIEASDVFLDCDRHPLTDSSEAVGIWISSANNVTVVNCTVIDYDGGFLIDNVTNSLFLHDRVVDSEYGFWFNRSSDNNLTSCRTRGGGRGVVKTMSRRIHIDPSEFCGSIVGIELNMTNDSVIEDSTVCNNTLYGIHLIDSGNITIRNSRTHNNGLDLIDENNLGSPLDIHVDSLIIDRPAGDLEAYTNLSLEDSLSPSSAFSINWSANPGSLPENFTSFNEKFVDIAALSGTVSIDSVTYRWKNSEAMGYDESTLELMKYNGSWEGTGAALDAEANTLTLAPLVPASTYGILSNLTPKNWSDVTLYGANLSDVTEFPRYNGTAAGNETTEGGNITAANTNTTQLTERWAAYFGNVTGDISLGQGPGAQNVFTWAWNPAAGGVVCASTNSTLGMFTAYPAYGFDIDSAWGFIPATTDSGTNTFNLTDCTLDIGGGTISNASSADTGQPGGFRTCALKADALPAKGQMVFCSEIIGGGTAWNSQSADFEIIVPTPESFGSTETYYFYANLN